MVFRFRIRIGEKSDSSGSGLNPKGPKHCSECLFRITVHNTKSCKRASTVLSSVQRKTIIFKILVATFRTYFVLKLYLIFIRKLCWKSWATFLVLLQWPPGRGGLEDHILQQHQQASPCVTNSRTFTLTTVSDLSLLLTIRNQIQSLNKSAKRVLRVIFYYHTYQPADEKL